MTRRTAAKDRPVLPRPATIVTSPPLPLVLGFGSLVSENGRFMKSRTTGRLVLGDAYKSGKEGIGWLARSWWKGRPLLSAPVMMAARYWWPDRRKRDFSNYVKALKDALNGVVYLDDRLVVEEHWTLAGYDKANPRAEVTVRLLSETEQAA